MFSIKCSVRDGFLYDLLKSNKEFNSLHGNMWFLHNTSLLCMHSATDLTFLQNNIMAYHLLHAPGQLRASQRLACKMQLGHKSWILIDLPNKKRERESDCTALYNSVLAWVSQWQECDGLNNKAGSSLWNQPCSSLCLMTGVMVIADEPLVAQREIQMATHNFNSWLHSSSQQRMLPGELNKMGRLCIERLFILPQGKYW